MLTARHCIERITSQLNFIPKPEKERKKI